MNPQPKPEPRPKKARKPLRRTWMRKKTPRRIARETPGEKYYKRWIHTQSCVCGCNRPVQQSHLRNMTGASLKENNFMSIAQCQPDHDDWTNARGRFKGMSKLERFAYFIGRISDAHLVFAVTHGCSPNMYEPDGNEAELLRLYGPVAARLRRVGEQQ